MSTKIEVYDGKGTLLSVTDTRNLDDVKLAKWNEINTYREVVLDGGMWFMGHHWGSEPRSRANVTGAIAGVVAGIPLPDDFTWRDNNNVNVSFTAPMLIGLGGYIMAFVNQVYSFSWGLKETVDALSTLDEVDNFVVVKQTWPDGNMDGTMPSGT